MPVPVSNHYPLLRLLSEEHAKESERYERSAPRFGIPVGGGDWMDSFVRCEALEACGQALRKGRPVAEAVEAGAVAATQAILKWNASREWQVSIWEGCGRAYIEDKVRHLQNLLRIAVNA